MYKICAEGISIILSSTEFDFFNQLKEENWTLCLDFEHSHTCDIVIPFAIDSPTLFISLCQGNCLTCSVGKNWRRLLDWLGASFTILNHFQTCILPGKQAWEEFGKFWPNPSEEELSMDLLLAIDHKRGEDFLPPEVNPHFAKENNIPDSLLSFLHKDKCVIAGSACLPSRYSKADVDIWILDTSEQQHIVQKLLIHLQKSFSLTKVGSVITCVSLVYNTIQIIVHNAKTVEELLRSFDFDCIRSYFDGTSLYHTVFSKYAVSKNYTTFIYKAQVFVPERLARYALKGFKMQQEEIKCLKETVGWPVTKEIVGLLEKQKQQRIKPKREKILFPEEMDEIAHEIAPWGSHYYEQEIIKTYSPQLFRGSIPDYVNQVQLRSNIENSYKLSNDGTRISYLIQDLQLVLFQNYATTWSAIDGIMHDGTIYPENYHEFKMQTTDPTYTLLHNAIIEANTECSYKLRSGNKKRKSFTTSFQHKKYQDVLVDFEKANVYINHVKKQTSLFRISTKQKLTVCAIPKYVNTYHGQISWKALQVFYNT